MIPADVLRALRNSIATVRAHNAKRAEFVRVYGHGRGTDEFNHLPHNRGPKSAATCRKLFGLAADNGISRAELMAAATGR